MEEQVIATRKRVGDDTDSTAEKGLEVGHPPQERPSPSPATWGDAVYPEAWQGPETHGGTHENTSSVGLCGEEERQREFVRERHRNRPERDEKGLDTRRGRSPGTGWSFATPRQLQERATGNRSADEQVMTNSILRDGKSSSHSRRGGSCRGRAPKGAAAIRTAQNAPAPGGFIELHPSVTR